MIKLLLRLWLAVALIVAASSVLLLTDRQRPRGGTGSWQPTEPGRLARPWKIGLAALIESSSIEEAIDGFRRGLKDSGLVDGRDFTITSRNAQGDIATLNAIFDHLNGDDTDLITTLSTPAFQCALRKVAKKPVVCAVVSDPITTGAGKSDVDHRPNVTGAYLYYPVVPMTRQVLAVFPKARRVGTLFAPGEINSVLGQQQFAQALKDAGLELVSVPVNGPSDVGEAALALCQSKVDVVCQIADNVSTASFPAIARACEMARTPLFAFSPSLVRSGAILALGSDYSENGHDAGAIAARVIRGEDPARIPFHPSDKLRLAVNLDNARRLKVAIPDEVVKTADLVVPPPPRAP
jgi:ABC-type uncharacterized transport system substrate-binding protein